MILNDFLFIFGSGRQPVQPRSTSPETSSRPPASWPSYDLTTIRQPADRMVAETVEAILGQIDGTAAPQKTRIDGPLMVRRSARIPQGQVP